MYYYTESAGEGVVSASVLLLGERGGERFAIDIFLLSFALMGMNVADLYELRDPVGDEIVYFRKKVRERRSDKAEMRVRIPNEILPALDRLRGSREWLVFQEQASARAVTINANGNLKSWCESLGIAPFTMYAARHTWASLARTAGVEKATIDECLAHVGSLRVADIYIEKDWELMNEANRKVLAMFDWKDF